MAGAGLARIDVALRCAGCGAEGDAGGPSRCRTCGGLWEFADAGPAKAWGGLRGVPSAGELAGIFAARRASRARRCSRALLGTSGVAMTSFGWRQPTRSSEVPRAVTPGR